ncbi:MAG: CatB-related O-acetyltransferase [Citrobacter sp.]|uniref:CatB-related O-acetyltransferase n=1 Tax=Citrobacter braakii TaxID=57706 RepID=UPI0019010FDD|nr:CatB-related O-acetyltransferase [Citrobacter braakii]MBJ8951460.1 CatB-related O-acetyltransferase [Citrobacter braakii]MDU1184985.1 CatB-related O-acetyltransferase [Citrobacter sp.]
MKTRLYNFSEDTNEIFVFRWTRKHYEFCMDNDIFLNHRGKKVYKERNLLLFSKGDKIRIEADVIAEQYSTMPVKSFSSVGAFSFPTCYFPGNVNIGRFCSIASNVKIMGGNHPMNRFTTHMLTYNGEFDKYAANEFGQNWVLKPFITKPKNTTIGNDVWIGNDVVLKGGISIGDGAVVAANSVVTKDVPPYAIVAGVPAKIIKYRFESDIIEQLLKIKWWNYNYTDLPDNSKCDDIINFVTEMSTLISNDTIKEKAYKKFNLTEIFTTL